MHIPSKNNKTKIERTNMNIPRTTEGLGSFLSDIIPYDRNTPNDTEANPYALPDLPALKATIRPAGVRRGKVNYTVDELPEIGRTTAPEVETARHYLLRGEHPERKIDITYPEHHVQEFPGIETVTHEKRMFRYAAERFIDPDHTVDEWGHFPSVYKTKREILQKMYVDYERSSREGHERCGWKCEYEPITYERWYEVFGSLHADDFKHHGAIPGTAKIVKERPPWHDADDIPTSTAAC